MYSKSFVSASCLAIAASAASLHAAELSSVGQIMPMVHISIQFNSFDNTLAAVVDSDVPQMTPLSILSPGDSFNPADPWYDTLDPSQEGLAWTRRYGFVSTLDPAPDDLYFWVSLDAVSAGLEAYYYRESPATFEAIFGTDGSSFLWQYPDSMTHPVFATDNVGNYSVSGIVYIGDENGVADPSYEAAPFTLNLTAVPEPSTYAVLLGASALALATIRRKR
ncbi:PEP-CTERM sorting domain-containing protein [Cerasicoccus maritimus]|uniref:PEP-CTERM sorting domain-containing protein n=1 Tax=Cerasicoccus maritimus TaxID=490089 RepID=UPI0028527BF5|nr:PEP-CTERM sorting domain-containing protein [Cerasicoccus maritimus]